MRGLKPNRKVVLGVLATVAAVAVVAGAFAIGRAGRDTAPESERAGTPSESQSPREADEAVEPAAPSDEMPEDVVVTLYEAAASGDVARAYATCATGFVLDSAALASWGEPAYTIETVTAADVAGEVWVQVSEPDGGFSDSDVVTWTVREEAAGWRICGWALSSIEGRGDFGSDSAPSDGGGFDEQASEVLGTFLQCRMLGDVTQMKALATQEMQERQPEIFTSEAGAFSRFVMVEQRAEDGAFVIDVEETWSSETNNYEYVVVERDGEVLVDERR